MLTSEGAKLIHLIWPEYSIEQAQEKLDQELQGLDPEARRIRYSDIMSHLKMENQNVKV